MFCCIFEGTLLGALSSCMTFLDLAEGDKLAVVVVELHVGPSASHAESGQTEYIMLLVIC